MINKQGEKTVKVNQKTKEDTRKTAKNKNKKEKKTRQNYLLNRQSKWHIDDV